MKKTPFYQQHTLLKAQLVPFAGYHMPMQYPMGILKEHEWVRTRAGLFDVSHMQQVTLSGQGAVLTLEHITPTAFTPISVGQAKYTVLLNQKGGIVDDCIITKTNENTYHLVLNASRAEAGLAHIRSYLAPQTTLTPFKEGAPLLALQGPHAANVLSAFLPDAALNTLKFMQAVPTKIMGANVLLSRTGYTGEDGFELSIMADSATAERIWLALLQQEDVRPIGLGARDTLRLEAGYPLYGQDIDETTSPVEAGLQWIIRKDAPTFLGAERIYKEKTEGTARKRMGVLLTEKGIARAGAPLFSLAGERIGTLTSGGVCPTSRQAIGQAYVTPPLEKGNTIFVEVRNRRLRAHLHGVSFLRTAPSKPSA